MCGNDLKIVLLNEILKNIKLKCSLYKLKNNLCTDLKGSQWNGKIFAKNICSIKTVLRICKELRIQ